MDVIKAVQTCAKGCKNVQKGGYYAQIHTAKGGAGAQNPKLF